MTEIALARPRSGRRQGPALPTSAMVLAAGLGERMQPLTAERPKPLIEVGGRALIDWALDGLAASGVERAVVNLHYKADQIRAHLQGRTEPNIVMVHEPERLETGGGIVNALPELGNAPFFVTNTDTVLLNGPVPALERLALHFDPARMDALLLLMSVPRTVGYYGPGDFVLDKEGRVRRRSQHVIAPYVYTGVMLALPALFDEAPSGAFSTNLCFDRAIEADRLFGLVHDGLWFHVGTPDELAEVDPLLDPRTARWLDW